MCIDMHLFKSSCNIGVFSRNIDLRLVVEDDVNSVCVLAISCYSTADKNCANYE